MVHEELNQEEVTINTGTDILGRRLQKKKSQTCSTTRPSYQGLASTSSRKLPIFSDRHPFSLQAQAADLPPLLSTKKLSRKGDRNGHSFLGAVRNSSFLLGCMPNRRDEMKSCNSDDVRTWPTERQGRRGRREKLDTTTMMASRRTTTSVSQYTTASPRECRIDAVSSPQVSGQE